MKPVLISVRDKTGLVDLGQGLCELGFTILASAGTAQALRQAGISVREVADYTGFPELLDGRVKTLHPRIHAGILADRAKPAHLQQLRDQDVNLIDLVIVNLYPFSQVVARPDCPFEEAIENIDIGGPALLRAAAKNHAAVGVVVDPADYPGLLADLRKSGGLSAENRRLLAGKAFAHSAAYEQAIAEYFADRDVGEQEKFPARLTLAFDKKQAMRYGENPHQTAAFYVESQANYGIGSCDQIQGKALSFNNVADADTALECVNSFDETACVLVKHANPCGIALGGSPRDAYDRAHATDPVSAYGGIVAFNRPLDGATAKHILERQFVEVIVVPAADAGARKALAAKTNVRVLIGGGDLPRRQMDFRRVNGGLLVQDKDTDIVKRDQLRVASRVQPTEQQIEDLRFAFRVVKFVKSNALVLSRGRQTIAIGAGQMSRVDCARIAILKAADAGLDVEGSVAASDAFFPFRDAVDRCAQAGVSAIVTPGGSIRDDEVVAAADEHGIALMFTGMRHFRH